MDKVIDYNEALNDDLPEQYKGKPNIAAFNKAAARQFSELRAFFMQLMTLLSLRECEGRQLDGIGDIVGLSRADALMMAQLASKNVPMDDDLYRLYLIWKMNLNTSDCTHKDVYRAIKMFWEQTPIYYSESIDRPATIKYTVPESTTETEEAIFRIASLVKAAGVSLIFNFPIDEPTVMYHAGAIHERVVDQSEDKDVWKGRKNPVRIKRLFWTKENHAMAGHEIIKDTTKGEA